jgi:TRAP-type mannitol/chloroaromatic compound transport system substrate-binding protein
MGMRRRQLLIGGAAAALATACARQEQEGTEARPRERFQWKMVTSWPANFPGLGTGAAQLARMINAASGGRLNVRLYAAGELVPAFEVFDAVSRGTAEMGHSAAYYWKGKSESAPYFCSVPFGFNAQEMNAWLYQGGGLELWREAYAPFGLRPYPAGNTGVQMAGWFKREINSVADLRGLKMRIPGLGGDVIARLGVTTVSLPGAEIFTALQSGAIDACEWVGPYNDLAFGLHRAAKFYYYPGWQEPGPTLECMVNQRAFDTLPEDLQAVVETCCAAVNDLMLADYTAQNQRALKTLVEEHGVELRRLPDEVLDALKAASGEVLEASAGRDPLARRIRDSVRGFAAEVAQWHAVSEDAMYRLRG